ncbi:MAG: hypothetical protein HOQ27_11385 [Dermatophilaceae bacterium]|nr:hypothetical protein [Dermatophilaceae bacterium]
MVTRLTTNPDLPDWARRHGIDPDRTLHELVVTAAPTKEHPNQIRVRYTVITDQGRDICELLTDEHPPTLFVAPAFEPRLRALDVLAAAGIEGTDATTALDMLLTRLGDELHAVGKLVSVGTREQGLTRRFGSDAARVAMTLAAAAEIRAELKKAAVDGPDLEDAVIGTLRLARSAQIGVHEALDSTLEARRRFDLKGDA